ncbi:Cytochrome b5-like heme/steroid binding domain [Trypanosoma melophagium]|uniref:Cytochrome b5-like heme/steroid binding domain n=1 Tax=Trypanosoma melophagium TaxID=715481 RepID=UPI00351A64D3|nr:Cytochrome b5-like heme/steroid binding domain [Trypanosoma melophagium]
MRAVNTQRKAPRGRSKPFLLYVIFVLLFFIMVALVLVLRWHPIDTEERYNKEEEAEEVYVREFFASAGNFRCPQPVYYTQEEVGRHANETDLWLLINKNVLDVSSFVQKHPGGLLIMEGARLSDAATLFAQNHDPSVIQQLEKFCIGRLKE